MKQTGAVIAAAGLSSRMGDFKPLLPFGKECVARHLTQMLARTGVSPVVMVTGYRGEELKQQLKGYGYYIYPKSAVCFYGNARFVKAGVRSN